ncbi:MAG: SDR family oxidoreductase [Smithella sp.]|jgi:NAD(P)-dependent dehydrogenase (short-subunit alcohol dehydrogenase family)
MEAKKELRIYNGATAIITGGAAGIGQAIAEELAKRGCEVVLADRQIELAQEVVAGITNAGGKATAVKLDVTDYPAVEQVVRDTVVRTGRLDYMFNNAGIFINGGVHLFSITDWEHIVNVNIRGVIHGVHAAYPVMLMQGFGHIVNTGSIAGLIPSPGEVSYAMTKHAVVGLSNSLRAQAGLMGIRVSVLCPGIILTPMAENGGKFGKSYVNISPELRREMLEKVRPMPADLFAKKVLDAVAKNRAIIIEPSWWKWFWRMNRLFPEYSITLTQKFFKTTLIKLGLWPK